MTHFKLIAMALITLAVGCSQTPDRGSDLLALGNGPDLPEECNICWEQFTNCFEEGLGSDYCEEQIIACIDSCNAPPPPPTCDHCAAGYQACVEVAESSDQTDGAVADCAYGFEGCLYACEREDVPQDDLPPDGDDCDTCMGDYNACVDAAWDEANSSDQPMSDEDLLYQCEDLRLACDQVCDATDPSTECRDDVSAQCAELGLEGEECEQYIADHCSADQPQPDPSTECRDDVAAQCAELGLEGEECEQYIADHCSADQPQPDPSADCPDDVWTQCAELGLEGEECEAYINEHCS